MPTSILQTTHGRPAVELLAQQVIELQAGDRLQPVNVLVERHTHDASLRRALARELGGVAAVEFISYHEMAKRIGGARIYGTADNVRMPAGLTEVAAHVRKVLCDEPGMFAQIADHPATAQALASAYVELRELDDQGLDQLAERDERAAEVVRVFRAARESMCTGWFDEADAIDLAVEALKEQQTGAISPTVVWLPENPTARQVRLVKAISTQAEVRVLVATTGVAHDDDLLAHKLAPLAPQLQGEEQDHPKIPLDTSIITTSDADEEVRHVVRAVVDALRAGTPARRIAVVYSAQDPYARLLAQQLSAAGVTFNGPSGRNVNELAAARFINHASRLNTERLSRNEFFALLSAAPLRTPDGRHAPLRRWRHIARKHYIHGSAREWVERLQTIAQALSKDADEAAKGNGRAAHEDDTRNRDAERIRTEAAHCQQLADFVQDLADRLNQIEQATTWRDLTTAHQGLLDTYLRPSTMPAQEQSALNMLRETLRSLTLLDDLNVPASTEALTELIELATERHQISVGTTGTGVCLLDIGQAPGLDADVVIVCGCAEGMLPVRPGVDPLLPADDREMLRQAGHEIDTPRDSVPRQQRNFRAATASATEKLILTMPRGDLRRTVENVPSRWLLEVAGELLSKPSLRPREFLAADQPKINHIQSFVSALRSLTDPATDQEYRLCAGHDQDPAKSDDPTLRRNATLIRARRSTAFTRFDGNLTGVELPEIAARVTSATRLESYVACPHAFYMRNLLRVEPLREEDDEKISPLDKGSLVHEILERFFNEHLPVAADKHWDDNDRAQLTEITDDVCDRYEREGRTGLPLVWRGEREEIKARLIEFLGHDEKSRTEQLHSPRANELAFGLGESAMGPLRLELPSGRVIELRGSIDRVDVTDSGGLAIFDYKSGSKDSFKAISPEDPLAGNHKLQLPIYAMAARQAARDGLIEGVDSPSAISAAYWFVLKDCGQTVPVDLSTQTEDTALDVIDHILYLASRGVFPQAPAEWNYSFSSCEFCATERFEAELTGRAWERKLHDPELTEYALLAGLCELEEESDDDDPDGPGDAAGDEL